MAGVGVDAGVGFGASGLGVAGCIVGAVVGDSAIGLTRDTMAALTTKAPPAAAMVTSTMVKAVVAAATGRMTRAKRLGRALRLACTAPKARVARWAGRLAGCMRAKAPVSSA